MLRRAWAMALVISLFVPFVFAASAVDTRYVSATVEAFRSLGFFGLGRYEPLDARFISMDIARLTEEDAAATARAAASCEREGGRGAGCATVSALSYAFTRRYAIDPMLGAAYRVVLTNLTDSTLGVVLAIDGLNTNGSEAVTGTAADRKWILSAKQTVRIAGWQVSSDEALRFLFGTPSEAHAPLAESRGQIEIAVYLPDPRGDGARGTGAGSVIGQPTVAVPFASLTALPVDVVRFTYARTSVSLGVVCAETGGTGVRIADVVAGTIAELRDLRIGDVITFVNAVPVNSCADFAAVVATRQPGDRVVLRVHRDDRSFLLTLELEE